MLISAEFGNAVRPVGSVTMKVWRKGSKCGGRERKNEKEKEGRKKGRKENQSKFIGRQNLANPR